MIRDLNRFDGENAEPTGHAAQGIPAARPIPTLERLYRADPGNPALALELGLAYARERLAPQAAPLLQLALRDYPTMDAARYFLALSLFDMGRIEDGLRHLKYAFRLNVLNVARFVNQGAAQLHGKHPSVRALLADWAKQFQEANWRGYA